MNADIFIRGGGWAGPYRLTNFNGGAGQSFISLIVERIPSEDG